MPVVQEKIPRKCNYFRYQSIFLIFHHFSVWSSGSTVTNCAQHAMEKICRISNNFLYCFFLILTVVVVVVNKFLVVSKFYRVLWKFNNIFVSSAGRNNDTRRPWTKMSAGQSSSMVEKNRQTSHSSFFTQNLKNVQWSFSIRNLNNDLVFEILKPQETPKWKKSFWICNCFLICVEVDQTILLKCFLKIERKGA